MVALLRGALGDYGLQVFLTRSKTFKPFFYKLIIPSEKGARGTFSIYKDFARLG